MNQELQRKYRLAGTGPAHQQRRAPARQSAGGNFIDPAMPVGALLLFRRIKSTDLWGALCRARRPPLSVKHTGKHHFRTLTNRACSVRLTALGVEHTTQRGSLARKHCAAGAERLDQLLCPMG